MTGLVRSYLVGKLQQKLREHVVVVWYDPAGAFEAVFDTETFGGAEKVRSDGGPLRLRHRVDPFVSPLQAGLGGRLLLLYVPASPLPARQNVLLPLECLGTAYQATLPEVAQRALRSQAPAEKVREWLAVPGITLDRLDELAAGGSTTGALAAVFGEASPYETAFRFLARPSLAQGLDDNLTRMLRELLGDAFGIELPDDLPAAGLRDVFAQRLLAREFIEDLEEVPERFSHLRPREGEGARGRRAAVRELAEALRSHDRLVEDYRRWAEQAPRALGLDTHPWDAHTIGRRDTFGFEERLALHHVVELAEGGGWEEAEAWVEERGRSFWARKDEWRRAQWQIVRTALRLRKEADAALSSLPSSAVPETWIRWYVGDDGAGAASRADRLARELASHHLTFLNEDAVRTLVELVGNSFDRFEQRLAERFVDVVAVRPEAWAALPRQSEVFSRVVAPLLEDGRKVVMVLADALRYEMGHSLAGVLQEHGATDVRWVVATLPTLTKVGMAALLPGAEEGIELRAGKQGVVAALAGTPLPTIVERRRWVEGRYGGRVLDLPLDACIRESPAALTRRLAQADLVLLRSQDIDQIGETDSVSHAQSFLSHVQQQLHAAVRKLARAGAEEFVVVADHGFILRSDVGDAMKLELPSGECLEVHRRCVLGRNLGDGQDYVRLSASDLGLAGGLDLAFPRGINVFKAGGGNLNYLHGGLSLQEILIPVVRHTPAAVDESRPKAAVELELVGPRVSIAFFQVRLEYRGQDLFSQAGPRRMRVEAVREGVVVGNAVEATVGYDPDRREIALESDQASVVMVGLTEPLEGKGTLELRVVDVQLGETLVKKTVPYDLAF